MATDDPRRREAKAVGGGTTHGLHCSCPDAKQPRRITKCQVVLPTLSTNRTLQRLLSEYLEMLQSIQLL